MGIEADLRPEGDKESQYGYLRELWKNRWGQLVLAAAAASPVLELVGAPTVVLHLAGDSGIGKSCLCRIALAVYGDPRGSLLRFDMTKDTANYVDARLGMARYFPVLIDETTILDADEIAQLAYNIAVGVDKGRLEGTDKGYKPTEPNAYRLVAFMSGEHSIRDRVEQRGATARIAEIVLDKPIFPVAEIARWYRRADRHHGWVGRDLIKGTIMRYGGEEHHRWARLGKLYNSIHKNTAGWCHGEHGRVIAFLAVLQLGYILMYRQLKMSFRPLKKGELKTIREEARKFAKEIYGQLNLDVRIDRVLNELRALPKIDRWVKRGHVPLKILKPVATRFGMIKRGQLTSLLRTHGHISRVQPRQIRLKKMGPRKPQRCIILTPEGVTALSGW